MYLLNGKKYSEDPSQKLGAGSEGTIYSIDDDPNMCVKIFHPVDLSDQGSINLAKYRAKKVKSICNNKLILPQQFIMPKKEVYNGQNEIIGFTMSKLKPDFVKLKKLLEKDFRLKNNISLTEIVLLFARIFEDYSILDGKIEAIGDVNTGSLMINSNLDLSWVDTDSYSYKGFPSVATTELFCHPELYVNLDKSSSKNVAPQNYHDTFSFTVMFVLMALWGAHPFRMGTHPKYMGLQERTKNGITIFDSDVTYPPILPSPEILSDDLLNEVIDVLKQKTKKPLDFNHLIAFANTLTVCKSCGTKYYALRPHCPSCNKKTIVDILKLVSYIIDERFFDAPGTILCTQVIEEKINIVCRVHGKLKLIIIDSSKNISVIDTGVLSVKAATYSFFNFYFVVCNDPYSTPTMDLDIYKMDGKNLSFIGKSSTIGLENGEAIYATSCRYLYRIAGGGLMKTDLMGNRLFDKQITQVFKGQTWFTVDSSSNSENEIIFGFDRALRDYQWFIIVGDKKGERYVNHNVKLPTLKTGEKLDDFSIYFNPKSVLLVLKTIYRGKNLVRYFVIDLNGEVKKDVILKDRDVGYEYWENISGKLYQNLSILHTTVNGIVKQDLNTDSYSPLKDTSGVIGLNDSLAKLGNKIYVSRNDTILTISKK